MNSNSKIFVISLESARDRRELMQSQLSKLGIKYQFVTACDSSQISDKELRIVNKHRLYDRDLTKAEVACVKSHIKACKTMSDDKQCDFGLFLEDDVILGKNLAILLEELKKYELKRTVCLFYAAAYKPLTIHKSGDLCSGYSLAVADEVCHVNCAVAYYISSSLAKDLSEKIYPIRTVFDDWDTHLANGLFSSIKLVYPFPVLHAELLSVINKSKLTKKFNFRVTIKNFIYYNKIFPFYQLFLWNRRRRAEARQAKFITAKEFINKKTYKL